ncbi:MAG TPA: ferrous iron transport protein B, partial [Pyrinomonadaceae bacterium]|nr:ferrous iron transport protein B [Pyrinomonadaceae bacterium]
SREAKNEEADSQAPTTTERIDRVLTHKVFGPVILILVMLLIFQAIFSWASLPMDLIDKGFGAVGDFARAQLPQGLFTDLLVDGVIAGVGGVLVFLPQILLLFFFIAILEDTGYMARAAFLMDRLMRGVGLHGKAFMPLLSSFACAIPGIMATRTIENPKDRIATIMIAPFMSCSARLPVYTLMIAAFFSTQKVFGFISVGALMILSMYFLGIAVAICVAWIAKRTILKSPPPPLVLEMPPYRMPNFLTIFQTIWSRAWLFVQRAGTVILAISIILWALATFPRTEVKSNSNAPSSDVAQSENASRSSAEDEGVQEKGEQLRNSFAGRLGHLIEPVIAPLGFDWKMGIALISSFAARETLVSTLSIIYNVGSDENESSLIEAVRNARRSDGSPAWTPLVAVSMMVFFVLALQCMSTVAIVRRETNSWRWPLFMVGYMLALAYIASFITFQGGRLLGFT